MRINSKLHLLLIICAFTLCISTIGNVCAADTNNTTTTNATNNGINTNNNFVSTGQSNYTGPQTNTKEWTYNIGTSSLGELSFPVVGNDGTVYVGGDLGNDYYIAALTSNKTLKWKYHTTSSVSGTTTGSDGTIYVTTDAGNLYALNSNGTVKWNDTIGSGGSEQNIILYSAPVLANNGTLYFSTYNTCNLYAVNSSDGTVEWAYYTSNSATSPVIGPDGTIYVTNIFGDLYAVNPDGTSKWSYNAGTYTRFANPSVGPDGTIYVGNTNGNLYALNPDGTLKWAYSSNGSIWGDVSISSTDGTIYFGTDNGGTLFALNPNGTIKWEYYTGNDRVCTIASDGIIYTVTHDNSNDSIYAVNSNGTLLWTYVLGQYVNGNFITLGNDTLYVASADGYLYAFKDPVPIANFTTNILKDLTTLSVQFIDTSSGTPTIWSWDFGDGSASNNENPIHTYENPGNYTINLTVSNGSGTSNQTEYINLGSIIDINTGLTYNTIQSAINDNNTSNGDTIIVYTGNYSENLILNKSIILEALGLVNINSLDPTQSVLTVTNNGSGSTIQGFNISGSTNSGIYIDNSTGNTIFNDTVLGNNTTAWGICLVNCNGLNNITGNNVTNCIEGINLYNTSGTIITNNSATDSIYDGIALTLSNNNTITQNNGTALNVSGIRINTSNNNTITNNNLTRNIWTSISLVTSQYNIITNNTASNNQEGMYLYSSNNNTITGNTASNNIWDGIAIDTSNNNTIENNNNITNNNSGIRIIGASTGNQVLNNTASGNTWADMSLDTAGNTTITGNTFNNSEEGIFLYNSNDNTLNNNTMNNNTWDGIYIGNNSNNNTITQNNMSNGSGYGIRIQSSIGNTIITNNFINNYDQAYDDSNNTWNNTTTGNYWNNWNNTNPRPIDGGTNIDQHPSTTAY